MSYAKQPPVGWRRADVIKLVAVLAVIVALVIFVYFADRRIDKVEEHITSRPPQNYQPPDLAHYATGAIPNESVAVQKVVYVPVYSHVYFEQGRAYSMETTLSIRNTDVKQPVYVRSVRYYDTKGKLVKKYVDQLIRLAPLETIDFLVEAKDSTGGSGANFIVEWLATAKIDEPIVEAVMVGVSGAQGIAFRAPGKALKSEAVDKP